MAPPRILQLDEVAERARAVGIRRIHVLGWRDLADPEAGGSELHLDEVASRWAAAGFDITIRTSFAQGATRHERRNGYSVDRMGGRMTVFPRAVAAELAGLNGTRDALVEIWNGVPWFSPIWARGPKVVWLHHVHGAMWPLVLTPGLARAGRFIEARVAPRWYRSSRIITLAETSRRELIDQLGFPEDRVAVVPPGIDRRFSPGDERSPTPLVVAVGRLVPVKRFELLIAAMSEVRRHVPDARLVVVGEGYEREGLEQLVRSLGAAEWVRLAGHVSADELLALYRQAWIVASASLAEGWGMTLTEAAACGTPAVVTDIVGHRDAVEHDRSGLVVKVAGLSEALMRVLSDEGLRRRLGDGALARAAELTWEATAARTLDLLVEEAHRCRR